MWAPPPRGTWVDRPCPLRQLWLPPFTRPAMRGRPRRLWCLRPRRQWSRLHKSGALAWSCGRVRPRPLGLRRGCRRCVRRAVPAGAILRRLRAPTAARGASMCRRMAALQREVTPWVPPPCPRLLGTHCAPGGAAGTSLHRRACAPLLCHRRTPSSALGCTGAGLMRVARRRRAPAWAACSFGAEGGLLCVVLGRRSPSGRSRPPWRAWVDRIRWACTRPSRGVSPRSPTGIASWLGGTSASALVMLSGRRTSAWPG